MGKQDAAQQAQTNWPPASQSAHADLQLVPCKPYGAKLTRSACVDRWRKANGPQPPRGKKALRLIEYRESRCRGCPTGAERAGETCAPRHPKKEPAKPPPVRKTCPICGTRFPTGKSTRIYCSDQCRREMAVDVRRKSNAGKLGPAYRAVTMLRTAGYEAYVVPSPDGNVVQVIQERA